MVCETRELSGLLEDAGRPVSSPPSAIGPPPGLLEISRPMKPSNSWKDTCSGLFSPNGFSLAVVAVGALEGPDAFMSVFCSSFLRFFC